MKYFSALFVIFFCCWFISFGQVGINADGSAPDNSAMLDVKSADKGFLPPRVALTAANMATPVNSPAVGLHVYNTATSGIAPNQVVPGVYYWNGSRWIPVSPLQGTTSGDMQYWNGTGWVMLPVGLPGQVLTVDTANLPVWQPFSSLILPPSCTVLPPADVQLISATLNGTVNANAFPAAVSFEYGLTANYGITAAALPGMVTGSAVTAVNASISGLTANTIYHYRIKAENALGKTYSADLPFSTLTLLPSIVTLPATIIQGTGAVFNGSVNANGLNTNVDFVYGTTTTYGNAISAGQSPVSGHTSIALTANVTGLASGTLYHFRARAITVTDTVFGNDLTFSTCSASSLPFSESFPNPGIPNCWSQIDHQGNGQIWQFGPFTGFTGNCAYLNSDAYGNGNSQNADLISPTFDFSSQTMVFLKFKHYFRAYAGSSGTLSFSADDGLTWTQIAQFTVTIANSVLFFQVISGAAGHSQVKFKWNYTGSYGWNWVVDDIEISETGDLPTATTLAATNVSISTSTLNGSVNANQGPTTVAFEYGLTTSYGSVGDATPPVVNGNTNTPVVSNVSGLSPAALYHYRVKAVNPAGTIYGSDLTFTTMADLSILTTAEATSITQTTVVTGGTILSDGGTPVTSRGVCWSISPSPSITNIHSSDGTGTGVFVSNVSNLTPNTVYFIRAYATNGGGTSYGDQITFTTLIDPTLPVVTTTVVSAITQTTAACGGNVISDGGSAVLFRGVCFSVAPGPTTANSYTTDGGGTGVFTSALTGLTTNTLYYVRAYSVNANGTSYGNEISFATLPTLTTTAITSITQTTALSGGNISAGGGVNVTARGVCWSTAAMPVITGNHTSDGTGTGTFISNLTGLTGFTLYYVRAYATTATGTTYGNQVTFTTSPVLATISTTDVSLVTLTTAASGGNITSNGGANVTARGVCWNTAPNPTTANTKTTDGSGSGIFTSSLTGLVASTQYYVRSYATTSIGTVYGNEVNFTTLLNPTVPTVTTNVITSITNISATGGGNVLSDGGSSVSFRGICWSTNPNPATTDNHTTDGSGMGSFTSSMTSLIAGTTYYVRAYAVNNAGTSYGNEVSFIPVYVLGQNYAGGIIFYIDNTGAHGLVAATSISSYSTPWGCKGTLIGTTSLALGSGQSNTTAILNGCSEGDIAARVCDNLVLNGYDDWFLPSKEELALMIETVGGYYSPGYYWSSSESGPNHAWIFVAGNQYMDDKLNYYRVRAVRAF